MFEMWKSKKFFVHICWIKTLRYFPCVHLSQKYCKKFSHAPSSRNFLFLVWILNNHGMGNYYATTFSSSDLSIWKKCCDRCTLFMDIHHVCPSQQDSCGTVPPKTLPVEIKMKSSNTKRYMYILWNLYLY